MLVLLMLSNSEKKHSSLYESTFLQSHLCVSTYEYMHVHIIHWTIVNKMHISGNGGILKKMHSS